MIKSQTTKANESKRAGPSPSLLQDKPVHTEPAHRRESMHESSQNTMSIERCEKRKENVSVSPFKDESTGEVNRTESSAPPTNQEGGTTVELDSTCQETVQAEERDDSVRLATIERKAQSRYNISAKECSSDLEQAAVDTTRSAATEVTTETVTVPQNVDRSKMLTNDQEDHCSSKSVRDKSGKEDKMNFQQQKESDQIKRDAFSTTEQVKENQAVHSSKSTPSVDLKADAVEGTHLSGIPTVTDMKKVSSESDKAKKAAVSTKDQPEKDEGDPSPNMTSTSEAIRNSTIVEGINITCGIGVTISKKSKGKDSLQQNMRNGGLDDNVLPIEQKVEARDAPAPSSIPAESCFQVSKIEKGINTSNTPNPDMKKANSKDHRKENDADPIPNDSVTTNNRDCTGSCFQISKIEKGTNTSNTPNPDIKKANSKDHRKENDADPIPNDSVTTNNRDCTGSESNKGSMIAAFSETVGKDLKHREHEKPSNRMMISKEPAMKNNRQTSVSSVAAISGTTPGFDAMRANSKETDEADDLQETSSVTVISAHEAVRGPLKKRQFRSKRNEMTQGYMLDPANGDADEEIFDKECQPSPPKFRRLVASCWAYYPYSTALLPPQFYKESHNYESSNTPSSHKDSSHRVIVTPNWLEITKLPPTTGPYVYIAENDMQIKRHPYYESYTNSKTTSLTPSLARMNTQDQSLGSPNVELIRPCYYDITTKRGYLYQTSTLSDDAGSSEESTNAHTPLRSNTSQSKVTQFSDTQTNENQEETTTVFGRRFSMTDAPAAEKGSNPKVAPTTQDKDDYGHDAELEALQRNSSTNPIESTRMVRGSSSAITPSPHPNPVMMQKNSSNASQLTTPSPPKKNTTICHNQANKSKALLTPSIQERGEAQKAKLQQESKQKLPQDVVRPNPKRYADVTRDVPNSREKEKPNPKHFEARDYDVKKYRHRQNAYNNNYTSSPMEYAQYSVDTMYPQEMGIPRSGDSMQHYKDYWSRVNSTLNLAPFYWYGGQQAYGPNHFQLQTGSNSLPTSPMHQDDVGEEPGLPGYVQNDSCSEQPSVDSVMEHIVFPTPQKTSPESDQEKTPSPNVAEGTMLDGVPLRSKTTTMDWSSQSNKAGPKPILRRQLRWDSNDRESLRSNDGTQNDKFHQLFPSSHNRFYHASGNHPMQVESLALQFSQSPSNFTSANCVPTPATLNSASNLGYQSSLFSPMKTGHHPRRLTHPQFQPALHHHEAVSRRASAFVSSRPRQQTRGYIPFTEKETMTTNNLKN